MNQLPDMIINGLLIILFIWCFGEALFNYLKYKNPQTSEWKRNHAKDNFKSCIGGMILLVIVTISFLYYFPSSMEKKAKKEAEAKERLAEYQLPEPKVKHHYTDEEMRDRMLDEMYEGMTAYDNVRGWGD